VSSVRYLIEHETRHVHSGRASTSQHLAHLRPRVLDRQRVHWHELKIEPAPTTASQRTDYFGNSVEYFTILTPYLELRITSRSLVEIDSPPAPADLDATLGWEEVRDGLVYHRGATYCDAAELRCPSPYARPAPELAAFARDSFAPGRPIAAAAADLMHRIHREFVFDPGATTITTPVTRVLAERRGVCQDFAHLQIACLRALGLAARYVSGYLLTDPPPGRPRLIGADASHAWIAVWCDRHGWLDLDPTNDVVPSVRHITLAWGRDYGDVSPLRGVVLGGRKQVLHVGVSVIPVPEPAHNGTTTPAAP
jgi:transglutaminase-like putative cysteine protease